MLNPSLFQAYNPFEQSKVVSSALFSGANGFPKGLPFNIDDILEMNKRHIKAMSEAQKMMLEATHSIGKAYQAMVSQNMEMLTQSIAHVTDSASPEEKIVRHIETMREGYARMIRQCRSIQDNSCQSWREASDVLHTSILETCRKSTQSLRNIESVIPELPAPKKVAA